jgi:hypothetical protein
VRPDRTSEVRHAVVARHKHPALDRGDVMGEIEGEGAHLAERADLTVADCAAQRLARVLDHPQVMLLREVHQWVHVHGVAEQVDRHDGAGLGRQCLVEAFRLKVQRVRVDVDQHRDAAMLEDRRQSGRPGHRGNDDLVTLT